MLLKATAAVGGLATLAHAPAAAQTGADSIRRDDTAADVLITSPPRNGPWHSSSESEFLPSSRRDYVIASTALAPCSRS